MFVEIYHWITETLFIDASCNFDIWYCGWENGPGSQNFTWTRKFGPTQSRGTGPSQDHTSGSGKSNVPDVIKYDICLLDTSLFYPYASSSLLEMFIHPLLPPPSHKMTLSASKAVSVCTFHSAGLYFYIEASGRTMGEVASLVSPYIQSNGNATCMVFYYHLYGHSIGSLRVKVRDQILWQLSGNQGNSWYKATVPLNFDGTYKVR